VTRVSIPQTLLVFVGAPAAIYGLIALAVLGPGQVRGPARYRPGRPWPHEPAWFVPHPDHDAAVPTGWTDYHPHELASTDSRSTAPVGGASGEW
jgi:hypothetical protein